MRFSFPIPTPTGGEYTSADALFKLLEKETAGTYLLGKSNFWHGGVHFTDQSAPHCKDKHMVRCMGDGEVVAYRQLSEYKATPWAGSELKYSSGFCLVRHRYTSPENTSDGPRKGQKNELTFFSVYMHLAPMNAYPAAISSTYRIKIKASDLKVRERAEVGGNGIGKIQRGAELEIQALEEINSGGSNYLFATAKLCSGTIHCNDTRRQSAVGDTVTLALRQRKADNTTAWFADFVQDSAHASPVYWQGKKRALVHRAVNLRDGDTTPGAVVATLPVNSEVEYDPAIAAKHTLPGSTQQWLMARCKLIRNAGNSDMPAEFWMCVAPDFVATRNIATPQLDTVVTCNQRIKAGDPIGFMGLHETAKKDGGKYTKHQVHVEIFSTDTRIKDFIQNKAEVTQGTQYLNIAKGTQLHAKSTATPPTFTVGDQTLKNDCIVPTSDCKKHKDAADKEWYEIKVKASAATVSGCIAASDAGTLTQHDWEKLGFKIVEAPVDFDGHLDTMASQPFFKKLYQTITGVCAPPDRDKVRDVLTGQAYQSQRSKIVAYHPSEWKADSSSPLWSVLNVLLHKATDRHAHEQARIDSCIWWDEVAGKVPELGASGMAWHWHPVGMVALAKIKDSTKWKIGTTSEKFETGGRGPGTISTGRGDHGGVSYGSYQLSSSMGRVQGYISQSKYKTEFDGLVVNSELFKNKWKEIAGREAEEFKENQHEFIRATHYKVQVEKLHNNDIKFDHKRAAIHDMIWSTSVQFGPETKVIINALRECDVASMTDDQIVEKVQQYKYDNTERLFSSSPDWWPDLRSRAEKEKKDLLKLVADALEIE